MYTCVTGKVQTSTSYPEASRPHSVSEARIFSSFQLLSVILTYKGTRFFIFLSLSWPILHRGTIKKRERGRERDRTFFWPDTHAKIATVPQKLHCQSQHHTVGECVGFWEKNACLNLVRGRMEHGLISALGWKQKDSRLRRFLNCHKYFKNGSIARNTGVAVMHESQCSRASAAANPMLHVRDC